MDTELKDRRREILTDAYQMSIGEMLNLYESNEVEIHPEFQRIYRWSDLQKTKLIESILLGIPIPSFFVSQREDGIWDVIDGVQRLSTIFEFVGVLRNEDNELLPPLKLQETDYLPSLKDKFWQSGDPQNSFSQSQRISFKREKIDLKIIKKESDQNFKYELFQRLNSLGSTLSAQELRNSLMLMLDPTFYEWVKDLSKYQDFQDSILLSENSQQLAFDMELVLRFFAAKNTDNLKGLKDLNDFITNRMKDFINDKDFDRENEAEIFKKTFETLNKALPEGAFRRYDINKGKFTGRFLISTFEVLSIGLGRNIAKWYPYSKESLEKIEGIAKELWSNTTFQDNQGTGTNVSSRLKQLAPLGIQLFS